EIAMRKKAALSFLSASLCTLTLTPTHAAVVCADLANLKISASEIGLPSDGASIASAEIATIPADPKTPGTTREFCKVLGAIAPVDPNAPPVKFEVNLPLQCNGKALQMGGGALNGNLVNGLNPMTGIGPGRQPVNNQP